MTRILDRPLAVAGRLAAAVRRPGRWASPVAVAGLLLASIVPALVVGATRQPTEISLHDLETQQVPAATSWFRLHGDLRPLLAGAGDGIDRYTLHDFGDDARAVTVVSAVPLAPGPTEITGRISSETPARGTFQSIEADVPTEPVRHDPWLLFGLPAIAAAGLLVGIRSGYPVVRTDRPGSVAARPLGPGETIAGRWGGRIANESTPLGRMRSCSIAIVDEGEVRRLIVDGAGTVHRVAVRRAGSGYRRICRTSGCEPAVEIHASAADLFLAFDDPGLRDRLVASLA